METSIEIIRVKELSKKLKLSKPTIWRMSKRGELPKKVQISERNVGFLRHEIEDWLESKKVSA